MRGVASITQVQIVDGLGENDEVALPGEAAVKSGDKVTAVLAP